jgi:tripartite-type tricarboxylate transporter receptor subunit TctC
VPFAAGGGGDIVVRSVSQRLGMRLGQAIVVDNRSGAGGNVGTEIVARAAPDGYLSLVGTTSTHAINPNLRKLSYDLERDLAPISLVVTGPAFVLVVHPALPARNAKELAALARSRPEQVNYASSGVGSQAHLAGALFGVTMNVKLLHVPFKLISEATISVVNGDMFMGFPSVPAALPLLRGGKLKAIGVTSAKRVGVLPDVPTLDESGLKGYDRSGWYGLLAPARTPASVISQLNAAVDKVVNTPDMRKAFEDDSISLVSTATPNHWHALTGIWAMQAGKDAYIERAAYLQAAYEKNATATMRK